MTDHSACLQWKVKGCFFLWIQIMFFFNSLYLSRDGFLHKLDIIQPIRTIGMAHRMPALKLNPSPFSFCSWDGPQCMTLRPENWSPHNTESLRGKGMCHGFTDFILEEKCICELSKRPFYQHSSLCTSRGKVFGYLAGNCSENNVMTCAHGLIWRPKKRGHFLSPTYRISHCWQQYWLTFLFCHGEWAEICIKFFRKVVLYTFTFKRSKVLKTIKKKSGTWIDWCYRERCLWVTIAKYLGLTNAMADACF